MESSTYIEGRLVGATWTTARMLLADSGAPVRLDAEGRFRIELDQPVDESQPKSVRLRVEFTPGVATDFEVAVGQGDLVLVAPQISNDPVEIVKAEGERLRHLRVAHRLGREVLAKETAAVAAEADLVDRAAAAVLASVAAAGAGDVTWRVSDQNSLSALTAKAVAAAKLSVNAKGPKFAARPGLVNDGERLTSGNLVERVLGAEAPVELRRRSTLDIETRRRDAGALDGLPRPMASALTAAPPPDGGIEPSVLETPERDEIAEKTTGLVDAIRLPEDPPLLVAGSAISAPGGKVELQGGAADAIAFHDFHELVLAMPSIWAQVFDPEFVALVKQSVQELVDTGAELNELLSAGDTRPEHRLLRMLTRAAATSAEVNTGRLRPHRPGESSGSREILRGMFASSDPVMSDPGSPR